MIFAAPAHTLPDVRNFLTSGCDCYQTPSFQRPRDQKKRRLSPAPQLHQLKNFFIKFGLFLHKRIEFALICISKLPLVLRYPVDSVKKLLSSL